MATAKQKRAARQNIRKAQKAWRSMSSRARARAQPEGRRREKPGSTGRGDYYHIEVRPRNQFVSFRTHDVGRKGGIERVAGRRSSGSWDDQKWLISKQLAHRRGDRLVPDSGVAQEVLGSLGSKPQRVRGDQFRAKARPNVPEKAKPTPAQRRARARNILKAQKARHRMK
jgi:hypothetical protein